MTHFDRLAKSGVLTKITDIIYQQCKSCKIPREDREDIQQEVLMKLFQKTDSTWTDRGITGWTRIVVRNQTADYYRRRQRTDKIFDTCASVGNFYEKPLNGEANIRILNEQRIDNLVNSLDELHSTIFDMRNTKNMSYKKIAETTGLPIGTVRSRLYYAKKKLGIGKRNENIKQHQGISPHSE